MTPNNPKGLDTFRASLLDFGNFQTISKPSRHGKIDKSKLDIKVANGTRIWELFCGSKAEPNVKNQAGVRISEATVDANVIPTDKSMSPLENVLKSHTLEILFETFDYTI